MFELSVTIDKASENKVRLRLASITKEMRPVLRQGVNASAIYVASSIKRDYLSGDPVHVRTGNLRRAVFSRMADDLTGVVGVGREAPYGPAVNYGSRPHVITAHGAIIRSAGRSGLDIAGLSGPKALRMVIGGRTVFATSVMHPGTQPTMFVEKALKAAVPKIREIMEARIAKFVKGHGGE